MWKARFSQVKNKSPSSEANGNATDDASYSIESLITKTTEWYDHAWDLRDKRVDNWPLLNSPLPTLVLIAAYTVVALHLGPRLMKNKKPYNLRGVIVIYNICMIFFNGYIVHQLWVLAWGNTYSWTCEPLDRSLSPQSMQIASTMWWYFICKYMDWFDTVFFILRKKLDHLSGLHVYHHMVMPSCAWFCARFIPGGQPTATGLVNCFVHVCMHFYYCISALGPKYRKYLWWKKYLTILQLVQFVMLVAHAMPPVFFVDCGIDVPIEWAFYFICHCLTFTFLFSKYYVQTYFKTPTPNVPSGDEKSDKKKE